MEHLVIRDGIFYIRIRIPIDIRPHFHRNEIKQSLRTRDLKSACFTVKLLSDEVDNVFASIRSGMLTNDEIQTLVKEYINQTTKNIFVKKSKFLPDSDALWPGLFKHVSNQHIKMVEAKVSSFLTEKGVSIGSDSEDFKTLCKVIINTIFEIRDAEKKNRWTMLEEPSDDLPPVVVISRAGSSGQVRPKPIPSPPSLAEISVPVALPNRGKLLKDIIDAYTL